MGHPVFPCTHLQRAALVEREGHVLKVVAHRHVKLHILHGRKRAQQEACSELSCTAM